MEDITEQLRRICVSGSDDPNVSMEYLHFLFESITGGGRMEETTTRDMLINTLCLMYGLGEGIAQQFGPPLPDDYQLPEPRRLFGPSRAGVDNGFVYPEQYSDDDDFVYEDTDDEREHVVMDIMRDTYEVDELEVISPAEPVYIVYLRLNPIHDEEKALFRQDNLLDSLLDLCEGYILIEIVMNSYAQMMRDIKAITSGSVATVLMLTHGGVHSIQTGANEHLSDNTHNFDAFVQQMSRIVLPRASFILTACLVGNFHGADRETPFTLFSIENNIELDCFANSLARNVGLNHSVYATTKVQVKDELNAISQNEAAEEGCNINNYRPMSYGVVSSVQSMNVFVYDRGNSPSYMKIWGDV